MCEFAHGVVERHLEHVRVEVNGIAGHVVVGPAPVRRLDEEPLVFQEFHVSRAAIAEALSKLDAEFQRVAAEATENGRQAERNAQAAAQAEAPAEPVAEPPAE